MAWPGSQSDEQCMWQVQQADDAAAFARLVGRWERPVQRMCARMLGDLHRAEDITQEAFARVFARRRDYQPTGRFSTWLWRIALNLCHDEIRRQSRRPELRPAPADRDEADHGEGTAPEGIEPGATPDEAAMGLERAEHVRRAVLALPQEYRAVVILRHYEGLKFSQIAEVLGIPEGTVKSRMVEALSRLGTQFRRAGLVDVPASPPRFP